MYAHICEVEGLRDDSFGCACGGGIAVYYFEFVDLLVLAGIPSKLVDAFDDVRGGCVVGYDDAGLGPAELVVEDLLGQG